jgi:hypothetical protein
MSKSRKKNKNLTFKPKLNQNTRKILKKSKSQSNAIHYYSKQSQKAFKDIQAKIAETEIHRSKSPFKPRQLSRQSSQSKCERSLCNSFERSRDGSKVVFRFDESVEFLGEGNRSLDRSVDSRVLKERKRSRKRRKSKQDLLDEIERKVKGDYRSDEAIRFMSIKMGLQGAGVTPRFLKPTENVLHKKREKYEVERMRAKSKNKLNRRNRSKSQKCLKSRKSLISQKSQKSLISRKSNNRLISRDPEYFKHFPEDMKNRSQSRSRASHSASNYRSYSNQPKSPKFSKKAKKRHKRPKNFDPKQSGKKMYGRIRDICEKRRLNLFIAQEREQGGWKRKSSNRRVTKKEMRKRMRAKESRNQSRERMGGRVPKVELMPHQYPLRESIISLSKKDPYSKIG